MLRNAWGRYSPSDLPTGTWFGGKFFDGVSEAGKKNVWGAERRGGKFELFWVYFFMEGGSIAGTRGFRGSHQPRCVRASSRQGVCGASTWWHTILDAAGAGPICQGSLEASHPATGPFTPGSGIRIRHGTTTGLSPSHGDPPLTQLRGPLPRARGSVYATELRRASHPAMGIRIRHGTTTPRPDMSVTCPHHQLP